jgi:hypothetical protein
VRDPLPYPVLPTLRADNAEVLIHPDDRRYGALLVGSMGSGKSSALLRMYLNDIRDTNAAPIVIDPKSELSRLCLALTPPECGKRVWFLDLGRPAFGMSPLRRPGEAPLATEAAAVAENIVAALLDINEGQIFQSSRRYLYHAVIGALALANRQQRRPKLEDIYTLLRPKKEDFRQAAAEACADQADLDQTAEFFRSELPDDLAIATSQVAQRLDAPRNKISGLTGVPPLRRFFNHPTDVPLAEIIEARDVLIVDANMGAIGTENSRACMHFILRMLHTQLQRQVRLPETERPRVPLTIDEAHYIAGGENFVDQIATHRAAGLEVSLGLQYFAQLGSGSQHEEKIRKGVVNLLQSRFLFRMGDARDAEEATRIAMAVYSTMIRDDPDSRARLRVTPEQALNFPNYHCLASWIAGGTRIPSFMGATYPWPSHSDAWARHHLAEQAARVDPYPDDLGPTLDSQTVTSTSPDVGDQSSTNHDVLEEPSPAEGSERPTRRTSQPVAGTSRGTGARREVRVEIEPPATIQLATSPVRRVVGRPATRPSPDRDPELATPDSLLELAFLDRVNEIGKPDTLPGAKQLPRLVDADYSVLALLDRVGLAPAGLIRRAVQPDRAPRTMFDRLVKLYRHGLVARHQTGLREHTQDTGKPPLLFSITKRGLQTAQQREPTPAISPRREWREIDPSRAARFAHDLHTASWAIAFHRAVGTLATDRWRTARYATGRYPVPRAGSGQRRHQLAINEVPVPDGQAIIDLQLTAFAEVIPDLSLELHIDTIGVTFDLLVELDLTARPSYNHDKFLAYDAFLTGWALAHPRYRAQHTRPAVLFACREAGSMLALAQAADQAMTGRVGVMSSPAETWYYAGRDHLFFALEADIHHGDLTAFALPPHPRGLRQQPAGSRELALTRVDLLPPTIVTAARER